jgi:hypothetical protein
MKIRKPFQLKKLVRIAIKTSLGVLLAFILFFVGLHITFYFQEKKRIADGIKGIRIRQINDSLNVLCWKAIARGNVRRGNIIVANYGKPYLSDIVYRDYGLFAAPIGSYEKEIMDSVLFAKYGNDFYAKVHRKADSLYKKKPDYFIDIDGYYTTCAGNYPAYKCGDIDNAYKFVEDSLFMLKLLPLKQNKCCPTRITLDAVITKKGKLVMVRLLEKLNPKIDSAVVSLLKALPCDWNPADDGDGIKINFRKKFYFFFDEGFMKRRLDAQRTVMKGK